MYIMVIKGTGKTICILSSTLAWIEHQKALQHVIQDDFTSENCDGAVRLSDGALRLNNRTLVVYTSRTHSQLSQSTQFFHLNFPLDKLKFYLSNLYFHY